MILSFIKDDINLILLPKHAQNERLLTRVDNTMSIVDKYARDEVERHTIGEHIDDENARCDEKTAALEIGLDTFGHCMRLVRDPRR